MLSIDGLNQWYGGSHTLWDVNLDVPEGSRTCLMGRNGMGKTTLLKCIMGLLPATGKASFNGKNLLPLSAEARASNGVVLLRKEAAPQVREIFKTRMAGRFHRAS